MGCYIPPSDPSGKVFDYVRAAHDQCPKGFHPLMIGDFNINLDTPRDTGEDLIAEQLDDWGYSDMSDQFSHPHTRTIKGRWTWRQNRLGRYISSKPDYFLAHIKDRKRFKQVVLKLPRHHASDHRAVIATIWGGNSRRMQRYRRKVARFPLRVPKVGPLPEHEQMFEELKATIEKPKARARPSNNWISSDTWALVDRRAALRHNGSLTQNEARSLGRQIGSSFAEDRKKRAKDAADEIALHLAGQDLQEGWNVAKRWYRAASDVAPKPCYESMEKQTAERVELYGKVEPPGDSIPINVDPYNVEDEVPKDPEIREAVKKRLKNGRAGGASFIRAENIKEWLRGMEDEEDPEKEGHEGAGDRWRQFVRLIQSIWRTGSIPQQMMWIIVVLIPKGGGDYQGIGLLEPFWKVIEVIMDSRLAVIKFHDCLHGFVTKRGCGTASLEAKLAQQLAYLRQTPLYGLFLDLKKAYDAMDRERCIEILVAYGVGPNMIRLLIYFWENAELVCRAQGRYGAPFKAYRGVTQGGPLSPKIFNIMVDAIVREWLRLATGEVEPTMPQTQAAIHLFLALFYADDGYIASTDKELLQESIMDILIELFERVGLRTNTKKTLGMTCTPGRIRVSLSDQSYTRLRAGFQTQKEWDRRRVVCDHCGKEFSAASLTNHLETQHEVFRSKVINKDLLVDRASETYRATQSADGNTGIVQCLSVKGRL